MKWKKGSRVKEGRYKGRGIHIAGDELCIADELYLNQETIKSFEITEHKYRKSNVRRFIVKSLRRGNPILGGLETLTSLEKKYYVTIYWTNGEVSECKITGRKMKIFQETMIR